MSEAAGLSPAGALAREGDEARFLAAMFAPSDARERLFALIAYNCELAKIPASVSEPMLGEIRVAWWREAVEEMCATGAARPHEAMAALAAAHRETPFPVETLVAMADARLVSLGEGPLADEATLERFLADTGGAYHRLAMRAMGGDAAAEDVAAAAGWAEGAGRLIAALPSVAGPETPKDELTKRIKAIAQEGRARLNAARRRRGRVRRAWRTPLLSVHMAVRAIDAALAPGSELGDVGAPSPFRARATLFARAALGRF